MRFVTAAVAALWLVAAAPALAESPGPIGLDEVRIGGALSGLELVRNSIVVPDLASFSLSNADSLAADLYFAAPDHDVFRWLGSPRIAIGGVLSLRGRESVGHAGLNWHLPIGETFFLEADLGLGIHNAALSGASAPLRNVGCPVLLHWAYAAGANLTENVTLTAKFQHVSSVNVCRPNDGINNFGVSLGWKF